MGVRGDDGVVTEAGMRGPSATPERATRLDADPDDLVRELTHAAEAYLGDRD